MMLLMMSVYDRGQQKEHLGFLLFFAYFGKETQLLNSISFMPFRTAELTITVPENKLQAHQSWLETSSVHKLSPAMQKATEALFLTSKAVFFH